MDTKYRTLAHFINSMHFLRLLFIFIFSKNTHDILSNVTTCKIYIERKVQMKLIAGVIHLLNFAVGI